MDKMFLRILNLSINASWIILMVIIIRTVLKKAPKWIMCVLWGLVAFRLIWPFSIESPMSLIPSGQPIPYDIALVTKPAIDSGIAIVNDVINPIIENNFAPDPINSVNPLQIVTSTASLIWIIGMIAMLIYSLISYIRLKRITTASIIVRDNIKVCDEVKSPFILGIIKPTIYVPSSMKEKTQGYVITHEQAHIKRRDHWWKPLGFLILSVYWFNPFCWIAYILLCRDIEMACDEKVVKDMDKEGKAEYSQALLDCSFPRKSITACPIAFGEVGVKERIKSVLNYKKPAFWIIIVGIVICVLLAVCFLTSPKRNKIKSSAADTINEFFNSFEYSDFQTMREYCTKECQTKYFHENDVFGMKKALLQSISEEMVNEQVEIFMVQVEMETVPESALYPKKETIFFVNVIMVNEKWLIDSFTTDGDYNKVSEETTRTENDPDMLITLDTNQDNIDSTEVGENYAMNSCPTIVIENTKYFNTGKLLLIEVKEEYIHHFDIPVGDIPTYQAVAWAKISDDKVVVLIANEWYEFEVR